MNSLLPIIGGLALFLYGMKTMGSGLEKVAGRKLSRLIEVLTTNRLMGVVVGAVVTVLVQSSSATTVMVIGFVNAGLMTLGQATGVIMGANLGTTITSQIIALDVAAYAPIAVAVGVAMLIFSSKEKINDIAEILIGFGILFIGMDMMGSGLKPLAELEAFASIMTNLKNPFLGALAGLLLTTVLQSSSASIGLLQALAGEGLIGIHMAFPILFGQNIGTTTTAILSSVGANKTAKRAAVIHFLFNLIGTIIFMTILWKPIEWLVLAVTPTNIKAQIANAHTIFNLLNVAIQFPFARYLVKSAEFLIKGEETPSLEASIYLDVRILETPSIALGQVNKEVLRMGELVAENLAKARLVLADEIYDEIEDIFEREDLINKIEREITGYLVQLSNATLSEDHHKEVNTLFYIINDIERVGDHVENLTELAQSKEDKNLYFSEEAINGLHEMFDKCEETYNKAILSFRTADLELAKNVLKLEDQVDEIEKINRADHIERLNKRDCQTEPGIIFLDSLSNLERVADHSVNIVMTVMDKYK